MRRVFSVLVTGTMVVTSLLCAVERVAAQPPAKAKSNQELIEKEAKGILLLAHPTVTLTAATYDKITEFKDGTYALTYKFTWKNLFDDPCYRYWHFYFTKEGIVYEIGDGATDTTFKPFELTNAALNEIKDVIRDQISKGQLKKDDPVVKPLLEAPNGRRLTVLLLQLTQKLAQN